MTRHAPAASCRTGKARYRDEVAAKLALARIDTGHGNRRERRAYRCPHCRGWHLTSRP
ncbi:hypothetical protein ACIGO8_08240 [Streptomyces sp. NPDC053493]|uniref:hypothetical protein n=1 Tax=Streptomyces sp. NPDC053493 TaxID=3365705 RepID=UPI0037D60CCB